jgi:membrane-associated phospholipid phosphatase
MRRNIEHHIPRRAGSAVAACFLLTATLAACGDDGGDDRNGGLRAERTAGSWHTWVLSSPGEIVVPPPPEEGSDKAESDLEEVKRLAEDRPADAKTRVESWSGPLPTYPWLQMAMQFVSQAEKNPPLSSRNYALVSVAMYDAVIAAWHYKYLYDVDPPTGVDTLVPAGPDPSYPSEHAAIAGAASRILAHLYPNQPALRLDQAADDAAQSRVLAGTNTPSDVAAGLDLGRAVADKVIAYAKADGSDRPWDGNRPRGIGRGPAYWEPPPGSASPPVAPMAATWKPWVLSTNSQFRPGPPPAYNSPEFRAAGQELIDIQKNLTPEQQRIAKYWEGAEGTSLPAGVVNETYTQDLREAATHSDPAKRMTIPESARAYALMNIAMADGGISVWDAKFTYWNPRPENGIRDTGLDRNWKPHLPTPRFPAYPSGSAGYAGAAQAVMTGIFPEKAELFKARAMEQAESRLYAGIHWRYDAVSIEGGRQIGQLVLERASSDSVNR